MSFDFSSLSTDTLLYFLTHSTVFVVTVASIFFVFGLGFGALTWGRYKWQMRRFQIENETLKDEVATLKRKLAEQAARLTSQAEATPEPERPLHELHAKPDPVVNSFLNAAAAILPQTAVVDDSSVKAAKSPESTVDDLISIVLPDHNSTASDATTGQADEDPVLESASVPAELELESTKPLQVRARDLIDRPGGDRDFSQITESQPDPGLSMEPTATTELMTEFAPKNTTDPTPETSTLETNGDTPPLTTNGDSRLISDPHLGLIYASRPGLSDDLSHLKGVASIIEGRLNEFGVYTFKQIALWNDENIHEFSHRLSFKDRIRRERWVEQARELHFQKYGERL